GEVREDLAVELDAGLVAAVHELVVREAVRACAGVDAHDPEPPERAFLRLAVAVGVDERVLDLLLRVAVARVLEAPVALGLLEDLAPLLAGVDGSLHTRHGCYLPRSLETCLTSDLASAVYLRKLRLRFWLFFSSRWARGARRRR